MFDDTFLEKREKKRDQEKQKIEVTRLRVQRYRKRISDSLQQASGIVQPHNTSPKLSTTKNTTAIAVQEINEGKNIEPSLENLHGDYNTLSSIASIMDPCSTESLEEIRIGEDIIGEVGEEEDIIREVDNIDSDRFSDSSHDENNPDNGIKMKQLRHWAGNSNIPLTTINELLGILLDGPLFDELLRMVRPQIEKQNTPMRDAIPASQRLSITLRYLATGNTFEDLKFTSAISPQSISIIVMETCTAVINSLKDYIKVGKL